MIKTKEELLQILMEGKLKEYRFSNVELKEKWKQEDGKKISAFANKNLDGFCWLCIGINDDGIICENDEKWVKQTEETVSQHLNQFLDPQITCKKIYCDEINNRWFVLVQFENPGAVVYWNKIPYKAAGTTSAEMTMSEVMELTIRLPGLTDYSAQKWYGNIDENLAENFFGFVRNKLELPILSLNENLSVGEKLNRLGIREKKACQILFGDFKFRIVRYNSKEEPILNETGKGLYNLLKDDFVEDIQVWTMNQLKSQEKLYSNKALKEAIANAIAHAAYFENEGEIILELFPNKISLSNLCLHDSEYFANKWFSRSHKSINKLLMETLRIAGYVDELGRGKNLIFTESLKAGKKPPFVNIEKGGRFNRWRLYLYGTEQDKAHFKLLDQIRKNYNDEHKALMAYALVLWRGQSVTNIKNYIEGESNHLFLEILKDLRGPIFYFAEKDEIVLTRWAKIMLGEGKDSKQLAADEEEHLFDFARKIQMDYHKGFITPKEIRNLGSLGETSSAIVLSSSLLCRWQKQGKIKKIKKGLYQFIRINEIKDYNEIIRKLFEDNNIRSEERRVGKECRSRWSPYH